MELTEYERGFIVDAIKDVLCEIEEADLADAWIVSQGVEDKLVSSLEILGESYE